MNTLEWNRERIEDEFAHCKSLKDLVTFMEGKLWVEDKVICEIHVNGLYLCESDEQKFANTKLEEIKELKIVSRNQRELVKETIRSVQEWLVKCEAKSIENSEKLRHADWDKAVVEFTAVVEGIQWLSETLFLLRPRVVDYCREKSSAESLAVVDQWSELEKKFKDTALQLVEAFQANDVILVSDLLEYEMTAIFSLWNELLDLVLTQIGGLDQ